jgi:hypothetical protein
LSYVLTEETNKKNVTEAWLLKVTQNLADAKHGEDDGKDEV